MKIIGLLVAALLALSAQTGASAPARHLVYRFGYNTKVANSGNGTGTTTVDILGPAADGGVMIGGTDDWWNTARPRATYTCEVYPNGGVSCAQAPYAISPMQLSLFPMLAAKYFSGLAAGPTSSWTKNNQVKAAIVPGASGFAGQLQKVPAFVDQERTHFPQRTVNNNDTIQLKLTTVSPRYQ